MVNKFRKNKMYLILTAVVLIALVAIICVQLSQPKQLELSINKTKIEENEFIRVMNNKKYNVTKYFNDTYKADVDEDFWTKNFSGEVPYEMLIEKTLNELKEIHSAYGIAQKKGYVDSQKYNDFIKRMEMENARRKTMTEKGEVVYGLKNFSEQLYLEYELDYFQKSYCGDLNNHGMQVSDALIANYYEKNKEVMFMKNDDISFSYIKIYYALLDIADEEIEALKANMKEISAQMKLGHSLESLAKENEMIASYYGYEDIKSSELSSKAKTLEDVISIALELDAGESSNVIDQNECLFLVECMSHVRYDFLPIEEVKDNIVKELRENIYNQEVMDNANTLKVTYDQDDLNAFVKSLLK